MYTYFFITFSKNVSIVRKCTRISQKDCREIIFWFLHILFFAISVRVTDVILSFGIYVEIKTQRYFTWVIDERCRRQCRNIYSQMMVCVHPFIVNNEGTNKTFCKLVITLTKILRFCNSLVLIRPLIHTHICIHVHLYLPLSDDVMTSHKECEKMRSCSCEYKYWSTVLFCACAF